MDHVENPKAFHSRGQASCPGVSFDPFQSEPDQKKKSEPDQKKVAPTAMQLGTNHAPFRVFVQAEIDVGTGTGILAIAAARAGAERVIATDINPNAALSVPENARRNGAGDRVAAVCMDLLSGFVAAPLFDVIVANLPKHAEEPRDLADRGWHGGPSHRDIMPLFDQAYERLKPNGQLYVMFSSHSYLDLVEKVIKRAGFKYRITKKFSIFIDSFVLYECAR